MWQKFVWITLVAIVLALINPLVNPVQAQEGTPTAGVVEFQKTASLPWYFGVLFFIAIAVGGTIFKARIAAVTKKKFTAGSCCAPLVEDGTRPFQPIDNIPEQKP